MEKFIKQVPEIVQNQILGLVELLKPTDKNEALELMAKAWLKKMKTFENRIKSLNMKECDVFEHNQIRGGLVLTYSGSLINIGPLINDERTIVYTSINSRKDVPYTLQENSIKLADDIKIGKIIYFLGGSLRKSSEVYKIAVCTAQLNNDEEIKQLSQAMEILTHEFFDINKKMQQEKPYCI